MDSYLTITDTTGATPPLVIEGPVTAGDYADYLRDRFDLDALLAACQESDPDQDQDTEQLVDRLSRGLAGDDYNEAVGVQTFLGISVSAAEVGTVRYLSISDVARRVGLPADGMTRYRKGMPTPAARVGQSDGWTEEQIDEWDASRRKHSPSANTRSGNRNQAGQ